MCFCRFDFHVCCVLVASIFMCVVFLVSLIFMCFGGFDFHVRCVLVAFVLIFVEFWCL